MNHSGNTYLCVPTGADHLEANVAESIEDDNGGGFHINTMVRVLLGRRAGQVQLEFALAGREVIVNKCGWVNSKLIIRSTIDLDKYALL